MDAPKESRSGAQEHRAWFPPALQAVPTGLSLAVAIDNDAEPQAFAIEPWPRVGADGLLERGLAREEHRY